MHPGGKGTWMMDNNMDLSAENGFPSITLEEICDVLEDGPRMLIVSHVNPDGDTIGCAFALKLLVEAAGGSARCVCPGDVPKRLRFLMHDQEEMILTPEEDLDQYDVICAVDVASEVQLGDLGFVASRVDFMIDHHGVGSHFAPWFVDAEASACGEILYDIYAMLAARRLFTTCPEAARRIYAAMVSDTGSFKFSNVTPKTHLIAADLVHIINTAEDGGMDTADVCRSLFGQRTLKELTAQMLAIQSLCFYQDGALGAVLFTQQMMRDAGLTEEDIGNVVDTPRGVEGVLVGISLRQSSTDPRLFKVSARANAECDVAAVCARFGGGGHVRAAGCYVEADSPEEALQIAAEAFGEAVSAYKNAHSV